MTLKSLLGMDPATYRPHALHDGERTYVETNCFVDCVIELVAAAGHEPEAMLAGCAAVDFEVDQWTFFKPAPEDLLALYGLDLHEMQPYRSIPEQTAARLAVGQTTMPEVDSFFLPDVAATDYRTNHVKSSIVIEAIDLDAKVLRYFHNAGYFELGGEDFDGLFGRRRPCRRTSSSCASARRRRSPATTCARPRGTCSASYLGRRPADNPFERFLAALEADLPRLLDGDEADYHAYAFHNPRMAGPRSSCWPATCGGCSATRARRPQRRSTTSSAAPRCCCSGSPAVGRSTSPA